MTRRHLALVSLVGALACVAVATPGLALDIPAPVSGDLTHLTFTAVGALLVRFLTPLPDATFGTSAVVEVATGLGGGVELSVNGTLVPFSQIGRRVVDGPHRETRYTYYGVALVPGPNVIAATPLGANGARGATSRETVYGAGAPASFTVAISGSPHADGHSSAVAHVISRDRFGHPALPGSVVRLSIASGDAHFTRPPEPPAPASPGAVAADVVPLAPSPAVTPSLEIAPSPAPPGASAGPNYLNATLDRTTPAQGIDVRLDRNGEAAVPLEFGLLPGDVHLRVTAVDANATAETTFFLAPATRTPLVTGLVTAGIGSVPGIPGSLPTAPNDANSRRGRIALYATGDVAKNTLGTLAYDTADTLLPSTVTGPFVDDPNERPYATYGDSSLRRDDALSRDHLYARIDHGRSSAMWGEFRADTGPTGDVGLGGFNALVSGARVEVASAQSKVVAFNARNDVAYGRVVLAPTGLSSLGQTLNPNIVVGSDTVTLVTLDRHTGAVRNQAVLTRNVDYTLDYATGFLRFINIPLPFDPEFNPQQVLVQYEYEGTGSSETTGGRAEVALGRGNTRVGVGYVNDASGANNFALLGEDVSGTLRGGTWSFAHVANRGTFGIPTTPAIAGLVVPAAGDAFRAALSTGNAAGRLTAGFESSTAGYANPFGGFSTPGFLDYRINYTRTLAAGKTALALGFDHEQNDLPGYASRQTNATATLRSQLNSRVSLTTGLVAVTTSAATAPLGSLPAAAPAGGAAATPAPQATLSALAASGTNLQAQVGIDYKVSSTVDLAVNRIASLAGQQTASEPAQTTAQLSVAFPKKGRVYVRQLWSAIPTQGFAASSGGLGSVSGATSSTVFGVERAVGAATTVDSEYVLEQTASGRDLFAAIGAKERFQLGKRIAGDLSLQHANAAGGGAVGFNVYGLSATYGGDASTRATLSYQMRSGQNPGSTLALGAAGALSPDVSLLSSVNDARANGTSLNDWRFGLAWRPANNERGVTLLEYQRQSGNLDTVGAHTNIVALDQLYRPTTRLELAGRFAYKLDGDGYYAAKTRLVDLRATQRIGSRFDVAGEVRALEASGLAGASANGFALEGGLRLGNETRVGAGYNFSASPDPSLALAPKRRGPYLTLTTVVDRIFGWGGLLGAKR